MKNAIDKIRAAKNPKEALQAFKALEEFAPAIEQWKKEISSMLADRKAWDKLSTAQKIDFLYELIGGAKE